MRKGKKGKKIWGVGREMKMRRIRLMMWNYPQGNSKMRNNRKQNKTINKIIVRNNHKNLLRPRNT